MARSTTRRDICQGRPRSEAVDDQRAEAQTRFMVRRIAAGLFLIVALNLALVPSVAVAGGRVAVGRPVTSHSFGHHPFVGRPFVGRPFVQHHVFPHHFFRPFVPFVSGFVPPLGYYAPYYSTPTYLDSSYYTPPPSYAPPAYYNPPVSYAPSYAPPAGYAPPPQSSISVAPVPNVVEYPNGRYVLRGDGTTTPYTWVWIPNPPSSPPASSQTPSDPPSRRPTSLYRWIDERGDIHLTDSPDAVPKKFRVQTKEPRL